VPFVATWIPSSGGLASTDVVENQHDMECVAVVEAKAAIGPVG
jgi:hypothetical protein